ncbi:2-oxo acid dehydrogenase subunit E2 [Streptosporangium amethystogenes]|uniref:2-oxo acid dehydrogenase subunit E2 n=1 Tax=Streptosporangium amethystogenes TaxID=2002 RepID=UPI0004C73826|nr:2-oxo acid dehydrogenase subunit E2 [Streptosporangium amethystogenes]
MADIRVPKLNNNDTEYLIVEWLVEDGGPVVAGEAVAVLETSKAADELEAGESGHLYHAAALNSWIAPGALLARVTAEAVPVLERPGSEPVAGADMAGRGSAPALQPVVTDPARAAMEELGISDSDVASLGLAVIRRADVVALAARRSGETTGTARVDAPGPGTDPDKADGRQAGTTQRLSRVQRAVARAVTVSHAAIPAAYTVVRFEVGPLLARTKELSRQVRRPVGLAELFVQAVAALHPAFPLFFASVDGDEARLADAPRVGVTFDLGEGLYVPVVRDTGSLREIAEALMRYRLAAAEGDFREKDLTGANIAVTLHTDADVVLAIPLIFPGTVCALAITSPQSEPVLAEDGTVTVRTVANIGLAYDHRLINGRDAALFLAALRTELRA